MVVTKATVRIHFKKTVEG